MPDAVEVAFHHAACQLLREGSRAVVAVSGGGDSVALLHLTARLAAKRRPEIVVAHLDHALRRGSGADLRFVAALAAKLALPCVTLRKDVRAARQKGESLEEAARRVRRSFLTETARSLAADVIATGHTLDDQAETILMRLARGAGPTAWSAMTPAGPGPVVKPLLGIERVALRGWLGRRRLSFRDDPSNSDLAFDRNRVRRLVIPVLAKALNPAAARHLVESAARFREDAVYLDALAHERFGALAARRGDKLVVDAAAWEQLPHPLAARVARIALAEAGCDPRRISSKHVASVLALAAAASGSSVDLPGPTGARRRGRLVEFGPCVFPTKS